MSIDGERETSMTLSRRDPTQLLSTVWRHATGFPGFHGLNAILALLYNVVQTLVLARSLGRADYAAAVAMTAVSLYVGPLNQAVARASFLSIREQVIGGADRRRGGEAATIFHVSQLAMLAVSFAAPAFVAQSLKFYASLVGFTFFGAFSILWVTEIQMVMLAVDRAMSFERANLIVRLGAFCALMWLYRTHDFLVFSLSLAALALISHLWAVRLMAREGLLNWPYRFSRAEFAAHLRSLWTSLQATFGEWVTLNASYVIITARFGVGPPLIAMDAAMKVLRFVLGVTRASCEVILPRLSSNVIARRGEQSLRLAGAVLGVCLLGALAVGTVLIVFERQVFSLLLGPNNVVPLGAGWPVALAMVTGVCFQVGSMVIGFFGKSRVVKGFTFGTIATSVGLAVAVFTLNAGSLGAIWCFSLSMVVAAAVALAGMLLTLRDTSTAAAEA